MRNLADHESDGHRADAAMTPVDEVQSCALDPEGQAAQLERYRLIGAAAEAVDRTPLRLAVSLAPGVDPDLVEETLQIERRCCPFFELDFDRRRNRLSVAVTSSNQAPALDAIAFALGVRDGT